MLASWSDTTVRPMREGRGGLGSMRARRREGPGTSRLGASQLLPTLQQAAAASPGFPLALWMPTLAHQDGSRMLLFLSPHTYLSPQSSHHLLHLDPFSLLPGPPATLFLGFLPLPPCPANLKSRRGSLTPISSSLLRTLSQLSATPLPLCDCISLPVQPLPALRALPTVPSALHPSAPHPQPGAAFSAL